jgi:hypothetical protein
MSMARLWRGQDGYTADVRIDSLGFRLGRTLAP